MCGQGDWQEQIQEDMMSGQVPGQEWGGKREERFLWNGAGRAGRQGGGPRPGSRGRGWSSL